MTTETPTKPEPSDLESIRKSLTTRRQNYKDVDAPMVGTQLHDIRKALRWILFILAAWSIASIAAGVWFGVEWHQINQDAIEATDQLATDIGYDTRSECMDASDTTYEDCDAQFPDE